MALPVNIEDLEEYICQGELDKKEKAYIWQTTIGLHLVDWIQVLICTDYGVM